MTGDGEGIPAEALPRIFDRFYRVDPARQREQGGAGLGPAVVMTIVGLHGGRITADSRLGEGTRMRVCLPRRGQTAR
ncbi:MAG: ATP-binding protein [Planctomycetota bacterium]